MILDMIVTKTDDGYTSEVPSLNGCESWAHGEDEVIDKTIELVSFYLNIEDQKKIKIDRARKHSNKIIYKLVLDK